MKSNRIFITFFAMFCVCVTGCSAKVSRINQTVLHETNRIGYVTSSRVDDLKVIDRARYFSKVADVMCTSSGLLGGLVKATDILSQSRQSKSLVEVEKKVKPLNEYAKNIEIEKLLARAIEGEISKEFEIVNLSKFESAKDLSAAAKESGVRLYFKLRYQHALGGYKKGLFSVVMDGLLFVYDSSTHELLLTKSICSDHAWGELYTMEQLKEMDQSVFENNTMKAVDGLAALVADEFKRDKR